MRPWGTRRGLFPAGCTRRSSRRPTWSAKRPTPHRPTHRHTRPATDDAAATIVAKVALVADAHNRRRTHVRVADRTALGQHPRRSARRTATYQCPSHFSHSRPIAMPGSLRHSTRSGLCLDHASAAEPRAPRHATHLDMHRKSHCRNRVVATRRDDSRREEIRAPWKYADILPHFMERTWGDENVGEPQGAGNARVERTAWQFCCKVRLPA